MVPVFKMSRWLNLYDTQLAVILMQAFSPLGPLIAWLLIRAIPGEHWIPLDSPALQAWLAERALEK